MSQALRVVFTDREQAKVVIVQTIGPFCVAQWSRGVKRLAVTVEPEENAKSIQQRNYYHGVILKEIAEQATIESRKYDMPVWKNYMRERFIGYRWEVMVDPMTNKKKRRKVRISSEDFGVKRYNRLIEEVTAFAVTDLAVAFSVANWQSYFPD